MPIIIQGGQPGVNSFDAFAFGVPSQSNLNFLEDRIMNFSRSAQQAGEEFIKRGLDVFNRYGGSEAIRLAKAAVRTVQHAFDRDVVRPLETIGAIQQAGPNMQRWIMACPAVRTMYHQQRCDGYSNSYVDFAPDSVGRDHHDWRTVNHGLVVETPDDAEHEWSCVNYFDEAEGDVELTLREKIDIMGVWEMLTSQMKPGKEDPTSPFCGTL